MDDWWDWRMGGLVWGKGGWMVGWLGGGDDKGLWIGEIGLRLRQD